LEGLAVAQTYLQLLDALASLLGGHDLGEFDQNVAGMSLGHHHGTRLSRCRTGHRRGVAWRGTTTLQHLQNMETLTTADQVRNLAGSQVMNGLREQVRPVGQGTGS